MFDLNAPADRDPNKTDTPLDLNSKEVGRYKNIEEKSQEPTNLQQTPDQSNPYAPAREPGELLQAPLKDSPKVDRTEPDDSNLSEADALKNEINRLDELAANIDNKLNSPVDVNSASR